VANRKSLVVSCVSDRTWQLEPMSYLDENEGRAVPVFQPAVCPQCGQIDAVRKVSSIVSEGNTTTDQFGVAPSLTGNSFYVVGAHGSSTTDLARRLAPRPPRPGGVGLRMALAAIALLVGGLMAGGLSIFVVAPEFGLFGCGNWVLGILVVTALLTLWPLLGIARIRREQKAYDLAMERARGKWSQLYYCGRDDIVFEPGERLVLGVSQLGSYLYG
jgi:hypothetical protein